MTNTAIPWYRVKHSGAKMQAMWQGAIGATLVLSLVVVPLLVTLKKNDMIRERDLAAAKLPKQSSINIKEQVRLNIDAFRKTQLEEATKGISSVTK
jgi:hypothetical protein